MTFRESFSFCILPICQNLHSIRNSTILWLIYVFGCVFILCEIPKCQSVNCWKKAVSALVNIFVGQFFQETFLFLNESRRTSNNFMAQRWGKNQEWRGRSGHKLWYFGYQRQNLKWETEINPLLKNTNAHLHKHTASTYPPHVTKSY